MSDFNEILAKHFAGETSPAEEQQVQDWIQSNASEYELLKNSWSSEVIESYSYNAEAAWEKVDAKIPEKQTKVIRIKLYQRLAYAASLAILIGVGIYTFFGSTSVEEVENQTAAVMDVELPDGTIVSLAPDAKMTYASYFEDNRDVTLEGLAFFEVARDEAHPFVIETNSGEIEVLGTAFTVRNEEDFTEVSVEHGLVALRNEGEEVQLAENEAATSTSNGVGQKETVDVNFMSWKTGVFEFESTPLPEVVDLLNDYYKNDIQLESQKAKEIELTAKLDKFTFDQALALILATTGLDSEERDGVVVLK